MKSKCGSILRELSLGKYKTKLYFGTKQGSYSTITGGILTVLLAVVVVVTSLNILYQTLNWKNYLMTTFYTDLKQFNETLKLKDF